MGVLIKKIVSTILTLNEEHYKPSTSKTVINPSIILK